MKNLQKQKGFTISGFLLFFITILFCIVQYKAKYPPTSPEKSAELAKITKKHQEQMVVLEKLQKWEDYIDKNCNYTGKVAATETVQATNTTVEVNVNRNVYKCKSGKEYIVPENLSDEIFYKNRSLEYIPQTPN